MTPHGAAGAVAGAGAYHHNFMIYINTTNIQLHSSLGLGAGGGGGGVWIYAGHLRGWASCRCNNLPDFPQKKQKAITQPHTAYLYTHPHAASAGPGRWLLVLLAIYQGVLAAVGGGSPVAVPPGAPSGEFQWGVPVPLGAAIASPIAASEEPPWI
jgi:hypothetical protein